MEGQKKRDRSRSSTQSQTCESYDNIGDNNIDTHQSSRQSNRVQSRRQYNNVKYCSYCNMNNHSDYECRARGKTSGTYKHFQRLSRKRMNFSANQVLQKDFNNSEKTILPPAVNQRDSRVDEHASETSTQQNTTPNSSSETSTTPVEMHKSNENHVLFAETSSNEEKPNQSQQAKKFYEQVALAFGAEQILNAKTTLKASINQSLGQTGGQPTQEGEHGAHAQASQEGTSPLNPHGQVTVKLLTIPKVDGQFGENLNGMDVQYNSQLEVCGDPPQDVNLCQTWGVYTSKDGTTTATSVTNAVLKVTSPPNNGAFLNHDYEFSENDDRSNITIAHSDSSCKAVINKPVKQMDKTFAKPCERKDPKNYAIIEVKPCVPVSLPRVIAKTDRNLFINSRGFAKTAERPLISASAAPFALSITCQDFSASRFSLYQPDVVAHGFHPNFSQSFAPTYANDQYSSMIHSVQPAFGRSNTSN